MPVHPDLDGIVSAAAEVPEFPFDALEGPVASSSGPAELSPADGVDPLRQSPGPRSGTDNRDEPPTPSEATEEPLPQFDPRHREAFEGLLYIGDRQKKVTWSGHSFLIRTLHPDEYKAVALLHQEHVGTIGDVRAYADAIVASCVISVDGKQLPEPIGPSTNALDRLRPRYEYVSAHWYSWTIDAIYSEFLTLEAEVERMVAELGKA